MLATIESLSSWRDLVSLRDALLAAEHRGTSLRVDLSALGREGHEARRLDILAVALLTNLLVGRFTALPLEVVFPSALSPRLQLKRAGLWFGLAQRRGDTVVTDERVTDELDAWSHDWRPVHKDRLFDVTHPDLDDERCGYYSNVHKLGEGFFRQYHDRASVPWLYDVIPNPKDPTRRDARNEFISSADDAVVEVFDNLGRHAFTKRGAIESDWLHPHGLTERSLLLLSVTRGADDRLHLLAMDNGYGIGRTLRWRHEGLSDPTSELITRVLRRKFVKRNITGHAGRGLWYLPDLARTNGGTVRIVTTDDQDSDQSAVLAGCDTPSAEDGDTSWLAEERVELPVRGTIIHGMFHLPPSTDGPDGANSQEGMPRVSVDANGR